MTASAHVDTLDGRRIAGRYRLDTVIGSGGAGTVWSAVDEVLGRPVAAKEITAPHAFAGDGRDALRDRTLREARAAARIGQHPNIVTVYDVVEEEDRPWIVMQLVQARSLADIIEEDGPCRPRRVAELGLQVLSALQAAHAQGILHRDVKPSNVLVAEDGRAVLTDFGIARIDGDATLTASGVLMGAPSYIPPERAQGLPATAASDLWALGATMYCAVEGRPPFQREGALATIAAAVTDQPDPTSRAGALAPLLARLLDADPAARPGADEVERALAKIAAPVPEPTEAETTAAGAAVLPLAVEDDPPAPAADSRRSPLVAVLAAVVLLAVVLISFLTRQALEPGVPSPGLVDSPGQQTSTVPATGAQVVPAAPSQAVHTAPAAVPSAAVAATTVRPAATTTAAAVAVTEPSQPPAEQTQVTQTSEPAPPSTTVEVTTVPTTTQTTQATSPAASSAASP